MYIVQVDKKRYINPVYRVSLDGVQKQYMYLFYKYFVSYTVTVIIL